MVNSEIVSISHRIIKTIGRKTYFLLITRWYLVKLNIADLHESLCVWNLKVCGKKKNTIDSSGLKKQSFKGQGQYQRSR